MLPSDHGGPSAATGTVAAPWAEGRRDKGRGDMAPPQSPAKKPHRRHPLEGSPSEASKEAGAPLFSFHSPLFSSILGGLHLPLQMAAAPSWLSSSLPSQLLVVNSGVRNRSSASAATSQVNKATCSADASLREKDCLRRRQILAGLGALTRSSLCGGGTAFAEEVPENYRAFVDKRDGYQYLYPSDWRDFDYLGHDSAFKDRFAALQHVRLSFIPTEKKDVHDLGSMEEVIFDLVKNTYAAPDQIATIYGMEERTIDGKNYWTFEYDLAARSFSRSSFATIGIGNGRFYTLVVGANERRWSRLRNKLKVVADSFKILDI